MLKNDERDAPLWAASGQDGPPPAEWEDAPANLEHFGLISGVRVNADLFPDWLRKRTER